MLNDVDFFYSPTQNIVMNVPQGILGMPKDIEFKDKKMLIENIVLSPITGTDCYAF